jgi:uncharacterized protein involved in tolerance to divalent cations
MTNAKRDSAAETYAEHCYKNGLYPSVEQHFIYGWNAHNAEVAELRAQLKTKDETKDEAIEVAVKSLQTAHDFMFESGYQHIKEYEPEYQMYQDILKTLKSINTLLGRDKTNNISPNQTAKGE